MKVEEITGELVSRAMDLYLEVAWPRREEEKRIDLDPELEGEAVLRRFADESTEEGGRVSRRVVERLGNHRYAHMKFVLEEYLLPGEFVFAVDTHDELDLKPNFPDYDAWQELKRANREIKDRIEARWRLAGLPTYSALKEMVQSGEDEPLVPGTSGKVLVVDDERDIADAVATLLIAEGFDVCIAHDGEEAVDTALREQPDVVLMDFQMPRMDGVEAAVRIRKSRPSHSCRILLATASLIDLTPVREADGFLLKPYSREILVSFIHALLRTQR